jgi:hypothetical protein
LRRAKFDGRQRRRAIQAGDEQQTNQDQSPAPRPPRLIYWKLIRHRNLSKTSHLLISRLITSMLYSARKISDPFQL